MWESVPELPELVELGREHRPLLDRLLAAAQPQVSELTFTNLYIWRHAYGARLGRLGERLLIFSLRPDPEDCFLLPPLGEGAGEREVRAGLELLESRGVEAQLARTDRRELARLGLRVGDWELVPDRDSWDYVYRVQDLVELPESRYREQARHLREFTRKFPYEYRRLTPELAPACQELQDLWCDEKHCDLYASLRAESQAVKEVLAHLGELSAVGGVILVRGRVPAFTLGEPLNRDTVVIHIEKATPELHGAFQVINQQFLAHEWRGYAYVNREQDMGQPGLRRAKEAYHPARMVEKYLVRPRG